MKNNKQIHQLVPGLAAGDAVTAHALGIQKILRNSGYQSLIFSEARHVSLPLKSASLDYREHVSNPHHILIYHFSIGSELSAYFTQAQDKKIMIYHNITPYSFFLNFNNEKAAAAHAGREQLRDLASIPDLALGDSEYNRQELEQLGYRRTGVLPLFFQNPNGSNMPSKKDSFVDILFVGRLVPNKKFEDLIKSFYFYQKTLEPKARLWLVGSSVGMEKYLEFLKKLCADLKLDQVYFTGHVSEEEKNALYQQADLFLCLSEHEGFCMPLLEAMFYHVPVVAYEAAAVPETLGGAGVLVKEKNFQMIAELMHQVMTDQGLKKKIVIAQKERLKSFERDKTEAVLKKYLEI